VLPARRSPFELVDGERWFAVNTLPFGEARAQGNLENQGFRTFTPKRLKTVRRARRISTLAAPFFPRYLFVVLDPGRDPWRKVNSSFGVARLVMRGDSPQPVPRGVVEALIASADRSGVLDLIETLRVGGAVREMAGPFADQLAILEQLDESGRVRVLLDILGRQVRMTTDASQIMSMEQRGEYRRGLGAR
jgi:transcription elongation factor/antiterminator RfaH